MIAPTVAETAGMPTAYAELRVKWQLALLRMEAAIEAEATTFAELIAYVEEHGLTFGDLDPRDWTS